MGGGGMLGQSHRERAENDRKMFRQIIASEIAEMPLAARETQIRDMMTVIREEAIKTNLFGSAMIRPDGSIIAEGEDLGQSISEIALKQFEVDLRLDISTVDRYGLKSPELIQATRGNQYLYLEAMSIIEDIKLLEAAISSLKENKPLVVGGPVEQNDTGDTLGKKLEGKRQAFREISEPESKLHDPYGLSLRAKEIDTNLNLWSYRIRQNAEQEIRDENPNLVPESDEFVKMVDERFEVNRTDPNKGILPALRDDFKANNKSRFSLLRYNLFRGIREFHDNIEKEMVAVKTEFDQARANVLTDMQANNRDNIINETRELIGRTLNLNFEEILDPLKPTSGVNFNELQGNLETIRSNFEHLNTLAQYRIIDNDVYTQFLDTLRPAIAQLLGTQQRIAQATDAQDIIQARRVEDGTYEMEALEKSEEITALGEYSKTLANVSQEAEAFLDRNTRGIIPYVE